MNRVLAIVEGRTEQRFVTNVLAPRLGADGVFITAAVVGKPGHKGGARYARVQKDILAALKQDRDRFCTTMFDYYGLPKDWPGIEDAKRRPSAEGVQHVERAVEEDVRAQLADSFPLRFLPYVQLHEFEALLFSGPEILCNVLQSPALASQFRSIVDECGGPEAVDDNPQTAPSKRIVALAKHYQKVLDGNIAAERIGLDRMLDACPHFRAWVTRLKQIGE